MGRKPLYKARDVLQIIHRWMVEQGMAPTVEEIREALGAGSKRTVQRYLQQLEETGDIRRWSGARGIQVLRAPGRGAETVPIPLVGEAPAGPVMTAEQNVEGWVRLPHSFVRGGGFFLLRVRGNSMNRARVQGLPIETGDLVLVRKQPTAEPGEVVVALIDGEATIKRFAPGPDYYLLKPESTSPKHHPILVDEETSIQGVVRRVIKRASVLLEEGDACEASQKGRH